MGPGPALGMHVADDALRRGLRPSIGCGVGHVGETGLRQKIIRHIVIVVVAGLTASLLPRRAYPPARCQPSCCGGETADRYLVVAGNARSQTSIAAMANRWPGPKVSVLTGSMAAVESTKMV